MMISLYNVQQVPLFTQDKLFDIFKRIYTTQSVSSSSYTATIYGVNKGLVTKITLGGSSSSTLYGSAVGTITTIEFYQ